ncbi:Alpha/Beta hydrolase protein [Fusarium solani]|uniref:Alpha/Beta hydrolase protein n=1 Tax=Fusarium solani TaxID=169388 RepID=A0A9P9GCV7_FUSSL|nr:Alpha/Beta hydrolase protein [Fusarium solani]KAH7237198.1 Alpha/Beta hydrolase protein [Fusarium solani]
MDKKTPEERDPILQAAIDQRPFPGFPFEPENRGDRRRHLDGVSYLLPAPRPIPEVIEGELFVKARDGYQIKTKFYRSASGGEEKMPLVILFHEGGWVMGDSTDEDSNARVFARDLGCVVLNPEYRLAPEFVFPTGVLDCWDVLKWAAKAPLGAEPSKGFIVGGSSAGANITAVLAHLAMKENLQPPITGQWLCVPYLLPPELVPARYRDSYNSMWTNRVDPVLPPLLDGPSDKTIGFISTMLKADVHSPLFSPFAEEWYPGPEGAPRPLKAFFQVAGLDPLRDHALVYQRVLEEEWHVPTRLNLYERHGHMFWANWPQIERSKDYWKDMVDGMRWLLDDESSSRSGCLLKKA